MTVENVKRIRDLMREQGIDAYIVPSSDPHQDEYVPDCWQRRRFLTGFTGSAGDAVVTAEHAGLWTDGRYFLQAEQQLDSSVWTLHRRGMPDVKEIPDWLAENMPEGSVVGLDPMTVSIRFSKELEKTLGRHGIKVKYIEENLVDAIWEDRPPMPSSRAIYLPLEYAGESVESKISRVCGKLAEEGVDRLFISALDSVCWLFNIRGSDIKYNPVLISYAMIDAGSERAVLFTDRSRVPADVEARIPSNVEIKEYGDVKDALRETGASGKRVWLDPARSSRWMMEALKGADIRTMQSPEIEMKAVKNDTEIENIRKVMVTDGVAMVRFLHWLYNRLGEERITELSAAAKLEEFRRQGEGLVDLSFETISAYGEHGAIIHYAATDETDVELRRDGIYLLDSGGQYYGGTTDITRTMALGQPTDEQREMFTRVLKGHIDLALARFPEGTCGKQLDTIARKPLWDIMRNYGHGTGHGVGFFLNVHEGPASISTRDTGVPLKPGMVLSNEPGYYREGAYGIRIENLVLVRKLDGDGESGTFYGFETLTLCPIDRELIDVSLLTEEEKEWLNSYHSRVYNGLSPYLNEEEREWLEEATRPI